MEFKQALCPLSKPSEFAASTENSEHDGALVANKDCLYINTYITKAFRKAVTKSNVNDFIYCVALAVIVNLRIISATVKAIS